MKHRHSFVIGTLFGGGLLAACGGSHNVASPDAFVPAAGAPLSAATPVSTDTVREKVLHRFAGGKDDGSSPNGALLYVQGTLYGTTVFGGGSTCSDSESSIGCGTIFRIDPTGSGYKVVHKFPVSAFDGALPLAGLTYAGGWLYGTTDWGGSAAPCRGNTGCGSAFRMDPKSDLFEQRYAFNGNDGYAVIAGLVDVGATLYGATFGGNPGGALYSLSGSTLTRLHPLAAALFAPIDVDGTLYGAEAAGGETSCASAYGNGCGIIYAFDTKSGGFHTVHRFDGKDGAFPENVINVNGTLYGATAAAGDMRCGTPSLPSGCGTVFKVRTDGAGFEVLHTFSPGKGGNDPAAVLADNAGTLYSTTTFGGNEGCSTASGGTGCGTVFKIDTLSKAYTYTVVYRFLGGTDGANPGPYGPIESNGKLYGTTGFGGRGCGGSGCGTIFEVTP